MNVAAQGCGDRVEHIVMDGLSNDGTVEIAFEMQARLRPDRVTDGGHADKIIGNAPQPGDGFFAVPKVVE